MVRFLHNDFKVKHFHGAHFFKESNSKLGKMWSFAKVYGDDTIVCGNLPPTIGTCCGFCEGCKKACYVGKGYRYPSTIQGHVENTIAFRKDLYSAFKDLDGQISRARKKPTIIRINESGELESREEFAQWTLLAIKYPMIKFYIYTKAICFIRDMFIPDNMHILISVWHTLNIDQYKQLQAKNVHAFVYDDGYNYKQYGLCISCHCPAYDKNGKMDKTKTCADCKLCFTDGVKVIGCYDH